MDESDADTLDYLFGKMAVTLLDAGEVIPEHNNGEDVFIDVNTKTIHVS